MTDDLLFLHYKSKYLIAVEKHDNGCLVNYPANYFIEPNIPSFKEKYTFIDNSLILESSLDRKEKEIKVYGYDNRFMVITDILLKAYKLRISKSLIIFFDGLHKRKGLLSLLPAPEGELLEKELLIKEHYSDIYDRIYFPADAEKAGILEGFNNITNLIVKGEL